MTHRAGGLAQRHVGLNHLKHVGRDLIQVLNLPDVERHHRPVILADQTDSIRETEWWSVRKKEEVYSRKGKEAMD